MYGIELCYRFDIKTKMSHKVHMYRVVSKYSKKRTSLTIFHSDYIFKFLINLIKSFIPWQLLVFPFPTIKVMIEPNQTKPILNQSLHKFDYLRSHIMISNHYSVKLWKQEVFIIYPTQSCILIKNYSK